MRKKKNQKEQRGEGVTEWTTVGAANLDSFQEVWQ